MPQSSHEPRVNDESDAPRPAPVRPAPAAVRPARPATPGTVRTVPAAMTAARPAASAPAIATFAAPATARRAWKRHAVLLAILGALAAVNLAGLPYYVLSQGQRVRSPWHPWLKPTGLIGQSAGAGALLLFLFMWLYPLRKKFRWLAFTGSIARWLDVHVAAGLCIPLLGATHAAWHFTGLIGLGYASMMVVVLSGVVGKYLYARIPHTRSGVEMSLEEIEAERRVLLGYVASTTGLSLESVETILAPKPAAGATANPLRWLTRVVTDDFDRWRVARRLSRGWRTARGTTGVDRSVVRLVRRIARREMALSQQVRILNATHQVFRFWHVAHRPVAISALVAVLVHVVVAIAMGVTWFL